MSTHSRIDPAKAAQRPVIVKSSGVPRALFSATYCSEKSWVMSAHSMTPTAATAAARGLDHDRIADGLRQRAVVLAGGVQFQQHQNDPAGAVVEAVV